MLLLRKLEIWKKWMGSAYTSVCLEQSIHLSIPGSHIQPVEEYKVPVQSRQTFGRTNKWTDSMLDMHVAFVIVVAIMLGLPKKRKVRQKHVRLQGMFDFLYDFHKYPTRCHAFRKALEIYPWGGWRTHGVHFNCTLWHCELWLENMFIHVRRKLKWILLSLRIHFKMKLHESKLKGRWI